MKSVVVKKCKSHRTGMRWLFWGSFALIFSAKFFVNDRQFVFLIMMPVALGLIPLYAYFENWTLTFTQKEIMRYRWGSIRRYSWNEVREVTAAYSKTEGEYVSIQFMDGKEFRFRMIDEHAGNAVKVIQSHHSIAWK